MRFFKHVKTWLVRLRSAAFPAGRATASESGPNLLRMTATFAQAAGRHVLDGLQAGTRPEEIEAAQAEIARLESQRVYLRQQLELTRVVSPIAGVVTTARLHEKVGQHVQPGDLIAEVHELATVTGEIVVPEKEIGDVKVGQEVVLKCRA